MLLLFFCTTALCWTKIAITDVEKTGNNPTLIVTYFEWVTLALIIHSFPAAAEKANTVFVHLPFWSTRCDCRSKYKTNSALTAVLTHLYM